jgi:hypothetical protein
MCGPCELRSNRMSFISNMSSPCCPLLPVVCITPVTRIGGNGQALRNNYTVELVAGATRDISERKIAEQQMRIRSEQPPRSVVQPRIMRPVCSRAAVPETAVATRRVTNNA